MSDKLDRVIKTAVAFVEGLSPEEREELRGATMLIEAVETAHLGPDEPVFTLRGQDRAAARAIEAWAIFASQEHAAEGVSERARLAAKNFLDWQEDNRLSQARVLEEEPKACRPFFIIK